MAPGAGAISVDVLDYDIEPVTILADAQWDSLPVDRGIFRSLGQELNRHIDLHRFLEGLNDFPSQSGDASKDVDGATLNAVLVLEGHVAILDLDRNRNQHGIAGDLHKVGPDIEGHQIDADLVADDF